MLYTNELAVMDRKTKLLGLYRDSAVSDIQELHIYITGNNLTMGDNPPTERIHSEQHLKYVGQLVDYLEHQSFQGVEFGQLGLEIKKMRTFPIPIKSIIHDGDELKIII